MGSGRYMIRCTVVCTACLDDGSGSSGLRIFRCKEFSRWFCTMHLATLSMRNGILPIRLSFQCCGASRKGGEAELVVLLTSMLASDGNFCRWRKTLLPSIPLPDERTPPLPVFRARVISHSYGAAFPACIFQDGFQWIARFRDK